MNAALREITTARNSRPCATTRVVRWPRPCSIALLLAISILLPPPFIADADARARRRRGDRVARRVAAAQTAFSAGRYSAVLEQLAAVPHKHRLAHRAAFLRAYAHYKLGDHDRAIAQLDTFLDADHAADERSLLFEARLLRAMLAIEKQRLEHASQLLDEVIADAPPETPWAQTAEQLRQRVAAELKEQQRREQELAEARRLEQRERDYDAAIAEAKKRIEQRNKRSTASAALDRAERIWPQRALTRYYRGYLCYEQRRFRCARARLREALAIDPEDSWARYMLALSIHEQGDSQRARGLLDRLASASPDIAVRQVARKALGRIDAAARATVASSDRAGGLSVALDLGTGIDSNAAYLDETPATDPAMVLHVAALLGFRHRLARPLEAAIGAAVTERASLVGGGADAHHTEPRGWATLSLLGGKHDRLALSATYEYAFVLYRHSPLLSQHIGQLAGWVPLDSAQRFDAGLAGWGGFRAVHDETYNYLEAARAGGWARLRFSARRLTLSLGYELVRDWADAVDNTLSHSVITTTGTSTDPGGTGVGVGSGRGRPGTEETQSTVENHEELYRLDYTLLEHGPVLGADLHLPWRLTLSAGAGLRWRRFDNRDSVTETNTATNESITTALDLRRDLQLSASAQLARALPAGLALALRFEQLNNWSSLEYRNYSRYVGELVLRWSWDAHRANR